MLQIGQNLRRNLSIRMKLINLLVKKNENDDIAHGENIRYSYALGISKQKNKVKNKRWHLQKFIK